MQVSHSGVLSCEDGWRFFGLSAPPAEPVPDKGAQKTLTSFFGKGPAGGGGGGGGSGGSGGGGGGGGAAQVRAAVAVAVVVARRRRPGSVLRSAPRTSWMTKTLLA